MDKATITSRKGDGQVQAVLEKLTGVTKSSNGWETRCPAHDDKKASLSVGVGADGRVLLKCQAGCATESVCAAIGLKMKDLFPRNTSLAEKIVATYDYTDEKGKLLFQVVRYDPKDFRQRRPNGKGKWAWNMIGVRRVLFRLPEVKRAREDGQTVFVCEGEKDVLAMVKHGFCATCNPGGAGKWKQAYSTSLVQALMNAEVVIIADKDPAGRDHADRIAAGLRGSKVIELPDQNGKPVKDAADYFAAGGSVDTLNALVKASPVWQPKRDDDEESEITKLKPTQGASVEFPTVEPWPEPVNGADVLNAAANVYSRYLALPIGAADVFALWTAGTHCFEAFSVFPRLNLCSPEKGCGKTTALDVLNSLSARPIRTESLTTAVLFRLVQSHKPTLLLDEVDAYLGESEDLRGLLNAGHRRGAKVYRCEGEGNEVRAFACYAPAALAGIGHLPGTLHDRSVIVRLVRAKPNEVKSRFDSRRIKDETDLCRKLARWSGDNFPQLEESEPSLPPQAHNRLADNWRPLFAIAEVVGGDWPERCTKAFHHLANSGDLNAEGIGIMLLADIRSIFEATKATRIPSTELVKALSEFEGRPWPEFGRSRQPITVHQLATQLRKFGVVPQRWRDEGDLPRGYVLADFEEPFARFLPDSPHPDRNIGTGSVNADDFRLPGLEQAETVFRPENAKAIRQDGRCSNVPTGKPQTGGEEPQNTPTEEVEEI